MSSYEPSVLHGWRRLKRASIAIGNEHPHRGERIERMMTATTIKVCAYKEFAETKICGRLSGNHKMQWCPFHPFAPTVEIEQFHPNVPDTWCKCRHAKYNHGEDDFSAQGCNVNAALNGKPTTKGRSK